MLRISILALFLLLATGDSRAQLSLKSNETVWTFKVEPLSGNFCDTCAATAFKVVETDFNPAPRVVYILNMHHVSQEVNLGSTITLKGTLRKNEKWDNDCFASKKVVTFFLTPASPAFTNQFIHKNLKLKYNHGSISSL